MKSLFNQITALSLRFRGITILLSLLISVIGIIAITQLKQELIPGIEFPQTIILSQATGMTSEQVLTVVTERLEDALDTVPDIVNVESTTTGSFGAIITARNDFGINANRLRAEIQTALDGVWFPQRRIVPTDGTDGRAFAEGLLADLPADVLIYIQERDENFLFQLSPDVWNTLSEQTTRDLIAYLAAETQTSNQGNALRQLVEQEIIPIIDSIPLVASISISGGQLLPDEMGEVAPTSAPDTTTVSALLHLSNDVWSVVSAKLSYSGVLNQEAVDTFSPEAPTVPSTTPLLPESWQFEHFSEAQDLLELSTLTRTNGAIFNSFLETGRIIGALGQTNDLTANDIEQMIAIEPSMLEYFEAEQIAALAPEVFDALPESFVANLDAFTRDALAAAAIAQSLVGDSAPATPVDLPQAWRLQAPQLVTFSFSDLPLATFSISSTEEFTPSTETVVPETEGAVAGNNTLNTLLGALSGLFNTGSNQPSTPILGNAWNNLSNQPQFANSPLVTAQDLVNISENQPAAFLNAINNNVPEAFSGYEIRLFNSLSPETWAYLTDAQADFYEVIEPSVLTKLNPDTLASIPESALETLDSETVVTLSAIASGEQPAAIESLGIIESDDQPAADPNAPALNSDWNMVAGFIGIELDTADDFLRLPAISSGEPQTPDEFMNSIFDSPQGASFAGGLFGNLSIEALNYIQEQQPTFLENLRVEALRALNPSVLAQLPEAVQERALSAEVPFIAVDAVTRTNGDSSINVTIFKTSDANTVEAYHLVADALREIDDTDDSIFVNVSFEQASFIEESISGVAREGGLGAVFAIVVILAFLSSGVWRGSGRRVTGIVLIVLFTAALAAIVLMTANGGNDLARAFEQTDVVIRILLIGGIIIGFIILLYPGNLPNPAWRSTIVSGVSIPLSILMAMAIMRWIPPAVHDLLAPAAEGSAFLTFILRLFPESLTLNIMTLSGLTVAIGRVVDDSIVVLENIFRQVQEGGDKRTAILTGTRDVSVAIFAATVITVVVFLPLGLTGGIIGEFFLPFGLAVTYALLASFIIAITVVPVMAYLLLDASEASDEHEGLLERVYQSILHWALRSRLTRWSVLGIAFLSLVFSGVLFAGRPQAFLPAFGEPQISISVSMPTGTPILETNALVEAFEMYLQDLDSEAFGTVQVSVGSSGNDIESLFLGTSTIDSSIAAITIGIEDASRLDTLAGELRSEATRIFGEGNVTVSAASLSEQGLGGFALILSGPQEELIAVNQQVIDALNNVPGLANVSSTLESFGGAAGGSSTYIRIDGESALQYTGELETENTLGVTADAKAAVAAIPNFPADIVVSEGFETQLQTEGFANLFVAMGIAIAIVIVILIITFGSLVHWLAIIISIIVAPVGAAIMLAATNRVLGISAMIGLLMLIGIVVTNAVVLIDRVQSNIRERKMNVYDALIEAGGRRLRPILMTALATIMALLPLAVGLSHGAIIASELGTVVIGGLFSSTLLTLIVVPVAYMMLSPLHRWLSGLVGRKS